MSHYEKYINLFVKKLESIFELMKETLEEGKKKEALVNATKKAKILYSTNMFLPVNVVGPMIYKFRTKIKKNDRTYVSDMDDYVNEKLSKENFELYGWIVEYLKDAYKNSNKKTQDEIHNSVKYLNWYYINYKSPKELVTITSK